MKIGNNLKVALSKETNLLKKEAQASISYDGKKALKEKQKEDKVMRSVKAKYKRKSYIERLNADRDDLDDNCLVVSCRL